MIQRIGVGLGVLAWIAGTVGFYLQLKTSNLSEVTEVSILISWIAAGLIVISYGIGYYVSQKKSEKFPELLGFYPNYYNIPWNDLLKNAQKVEIVVCYFDSWAKNNWELLHNIFKRNGDISIFLTNPESRTHLSVLQDRFPDHSKEELKKLIWDTVHIIEDAYRKSQPNNGEYKVYFIDQTLNYSIVRIDSKYLVHSTYEQFRQRRIGNFGIVINLNNSEHLKNFFDKEFAEFIKKSTVVELEAR